MKERITRVLSQVFGIPPEKIDDDSSPDTISEWDSLQHMNLILALEQEFGVQFNEEQIAEMVNFQLIELSLQESLQHGHSVT